MPKRVQLSDQSPLVIAFDPGESTGIVWVSGGAIVYTQTVGYQEFFDYAADYAWRQAAEFVIEQFRLYPWAASKLGFDGLIPVRVIGAVELLAAQQKKHLEFIDASTAKRFCTDTLLQDYGWWHRLKTKHEKDAARHALYYLLVRRPKRKETLDVSPEDRSR